VTGLDAVGGLPWKLACITVGVIPIPTMAADLPEKYRTIIFLRDLEQHCIAEGLRLTISGVKTRLQLDQSPLRNRACQ
jgi:hypothetical protein